MDDILDLSPALSERELEIVLRNLEDPDADVRRESIADLYSAEPELIPRLFALADEDPDEGVRCQAIRALGLYLYEGEMADYGMDWGDLEEIMREDELPQEDFLRVKEFVLGVYRDEARSLEERRAAVEALGFLLDDEVVDIIEEAYAHPESPMKISAIFAMGRNGIGRWASILRRELYNPNPDIQWEAVRAAGEAQLEELGKDLWRLTYSKDPDVQKMAIWALGQSGWEGAFERLDALSASTDPELHEIAEEALGDWLIFRQVTDEEDTELEDEFLALD